MKWPAQEKQWYPCASWIGSFVQIQHFVIPLQILIGYIMNVRSRFVGSLAGPKLSLGLNHPVSDILGDSKFVCNSGSFRVHGFSRSYLLQALAGVTSVLSGELTDPNRLLLSVGSSSTQVGMNSVANPETWNGGREVSAAWMLFYPCFIEISMMTLGDTSWKIIRGRPMMRRVLTLSVPTGTKVGEWNQWRLCLVENSAGCECWSIAGADFCYPKSRQNLWAPYLQRILRAGRCSKSNESTVNPKADPSHQLHWLLCLVVWVKKTPAMLCDVMVITVYHTIYYAHGF